MRRPAARLLLSWVPVVLLTVAVVALWDLRYEPGGCSEVLTAGSQDRFDVWGWVLRVAQWSWALGAGAWLVRSVLTSSQPAPAPWRMGLAVAGGLGLVVLSGTLLALEGLLVFLGVLLLGGGGLVVAAAVAAALTFRTPSPPGFRGALYAWLAVCVLLAPIGLGALSASRAGTLC